MQRKPHISVVHGKGTQNTRAAEPSWWVTSWRPFILIAIAVMIAYGWTTSFGFVRFDDNLLRLDSPVTLMSNPPALFSPYLGSYFRPFVTASLDIDRRIGNGNLWIYHCSNVVYHALASMLTFLLIVQIGLNRREALSAALVFAVHPAASQAVAWIPGRNDLLLGVFALASVLTFGKAQTYSKYWLIVHWLMLCCALMSKETAVVIPVIAIAWCVLLEQSQASFRLLMLAALGWIIIFAGWWMLRASALQGVTSHEVVVSLAGLILNARSLVEAIGKLILPVTLSPYPVYSTLATGLGMLCIIGGGAVAMRWRARLGKRTMFALGWFLIFLTPSLLVSFSDGQIRFDYLESRWYVASFGLILLIVDGVALTEHADRSRWGVVVGVVIVLSVLAVRASAPYGDQVTFWNRAVEDAPSSSHALFNRAVVAEEVEHNSATAIEWYGKAIAAGPGIALYHNSLGVLYRMVGRPDEARNEFQASIRLDSAYVLPMGNLAYMEYVDQRLDSAILLWNKILRIDSTFSDVEKNLVIVYARQGRMPEARLHYQHLISRNVTVDTALASLVR